MDSKVTTQEQLGALTDRGIGFITLRARTPKLTAALHALPTKAWTSMTVARAGGSTRTVRVIDDPAAVDEPGRGLLQELPPGVDACDLSALTRWLDGVGTTRTGPLEPGPMGLGAWRDYLKREAGVAVLLAQGFHSP
jgi:hypothetical protein